MSLAIGTRLGSYEIQSATGAGGMGEVYRARDTRLDRNVAIKVLPPAFAQDAERLARFEREAKLLASLNHPRIAQIYGLEGDGITGSIRAIAMELVEGETLEERLARGSVPVDEALPIARQIAEALEAAHAQGITHRDLKPATGRRVFETGETVSDAVAVILTREPDWTALSPDIPASIRALLRRCLQKDPQRRFHHIADVRLELEEAASPQPDDPTIVRSGRTATVWIRAVPWIVAALALVIAVWALSSSPANSAAGLAPVRRLELTLPPGVELFTASTRTVAVSPDGARLAFVGALGGNRQVYIRPLDQFEATPLRGSDGATACFFSPDGRSIGLVTSSGVLKTISLADGLVATFTGDASFLYGAAWTADDQIIFVRAGALWQVPRTGGAPRSLTVLGGERRTVVDRGTLPLYAASGHLVFFRDNELLAAPFDDARLQLTGPAVQVITSLPASAPGCRS